MMSPGPSEEAGKVAIGVIEALRTQPGLLLVVLVNLLFMAAVFWSVRDQRHYQHEIMTALVQALAKCSGDR